MNNNINIYQHICLCFIKYYIHLFIFLSYRVFITLHFIYLIICKLSVFCSTKSLILKKIETGRRKCNILYFFFLNSLQNANKSILIFWTRENKQLTVLIVKISCIDLLCYIIYSFMSHIYI